jgi:hypothetical protein
VSEKTSRNPPAVGVDLHVRQSLGENSPHTISLLVRIIDFAEGGSALARAFPTPARRPECPPNHFRTGVNCLT